MKRKYLIFDAGRQRQKIEEICEIFPDIGVAILSQALIIESVNLGNLPRFVIASKDCDPVLESDLENNE